MYIMRSNIKEIKKILKEDTFTDEGESSSSTGFVQPRSIRSGTGTPRRPTSGRLGQAKVEEFSILGQNPLTTYNTIVGSTLRKYRTIAGT